MNVQLNEYQWIEHLFFRFEDSFFQPTDSEPSHKHPPDTQLLVCIIGFVKENIHLNIRMIIYAF